MTHHIVKHDRGNYMIGLFRDADSAERCIGELKQSGIHADDISLAMKGKERTREVAQETGVSRIGRQGNLGGIMDMLGLGAGLVQSLQDMGCSKDVAQRYADRVEAGNILLAVKCNGLCERTRPILDRCGAFDIQSNREERESKSQVRKDVPRVEKEGEITEEELRERESRER